ncbi:thiol peroxidase [Aggregatilinea lenta]|uniref:thiol peroxidase n=1 Tax=Aggregatilinea lenta TaxID=913108 RepID=UPI001EE99424|nr:thiol peroxidase [Aggregatilinea lenta]
MGSARPGMRVGANEHPITGDMLQVGDTAPNFVLAGIGMVEKSLSDYGSKIKILSVVPSIDTSVCAAQTRRFEAEGIELGADNIVILTISADLPYALRRWSEDAGTSRIEYLSTHRDMQFSKDYGVYDEMWRINQRALFVLDGDNSVRYAEYVPVMSDEVNFDAALDVVRSLL